MLNAQEQHPRAAHWGGKSCGDEGWKSVSSGTRRELFLHPGSAPWQPARGWELCETLRLCQLSLHPQQHQRRWVSDGGKLPAAGGRAPCCGGQSPHLLACLGRCAGGSGLGKPLRLLQPPEYCPLLFFHTGNDSTARGNQEHTKSDCMALGVTAKGGPGGPLLNPAAEEEGLEKRWMDSVGQYAVAQLGLTTGIWLLQGQSPLRGPDRARQK